MHVLRHRAPRALLLASALLCATSAVALAVSTLDQAQDGEVRFGRGLATTADQRVQIFTAGITGRLDRIELPLNRVRHPGDLVVDVRATGGGRTIGQPGHFIEVTAGLPGPVISSMRLSEASLGLPDDAGTGFGPAHWVMIELALPVNVEAGTQYGLDLWQPNQQEGVYFWGRGSAANGTDWYRRGQPLSHQVSEPPIDFSYWFEENLDPDSGFRTFVTPRSPLPGGGDPGGGGPPAGETPELGSLALLASGLLGFGGYARLRLRGARRRR